MERFASGQGRTTVATTETGTNAMASAQPPIPLQEAFWNRWAVEAIGKGNEEISLRQAHVITGWLRDLGASDRDILEVGCGAGWFCPQLRRFGRVTGTDLSARQIDGARQRFPDCRFVAGDFMNLNLGRERYDVVVTLEVLAHVADQIGFVGRIARLLRPDGLLMLATQNRPVLERHNRISPPGVGQIRRWVDAEELRVLLAPRFDVIELRSVTPRANRGPMRLVNSRLLNRPIRALLGDRIEEFKERLGLGWTLMALARKRGG